MDLQPKILSNLPKKQSEENKSDEVILNMLKAEHQKEFGFRILVDKYKKQVYWQARRNLVIHEDADDVAQNVFIKVWKGVSNFRGDSKLSSWIFRITANEIINYANARKTSKNIFSDSDLSLERAFSPDTFIGNDIEKEFQKALLTIPPRQRMVFTMRYYDETPFDSIAEQLNLSTGAVKASYHHAAEKMKIFLLDL